MSNQNIKINTLIKHMVGVPGLEPGTSPLSGVHSNQLSYTPIWSTSKILIIFDNQT